MTVLPLYAEQFRSQDTTRSYEDVAGEHGPIIDLAATAAGYMAVKGTCKVLDVCCGNSTFLVDLEERVPGIETTGLDMYPVDQMDTFRDPRLERQRHIVADANNIPLEDRGFDLIVSTWGISEYSRTGGFVNLPRTYIGEIGRLLLPGGTASIVPEKFNLGFLLNATPGVIKNIRVNDPMTWRKATDYRSLHERGFGLEQDLDKKTVLIHKP